MSCGVDRGKRRTRGLLHSFRYDALSVAVTMTKCVTPRGPATCTKSFITLRLLTLRFTAVWGRIIVRTSAQISRTSDLLEPWAHTKLLGGPLTDGSAAGSRCVRFFFCIYS
jgi:hypothetical protein